MQNDIVYDIAIIGGGISSCVFASNYIKNGFKGRIAIIENGRDLGGRASTRTSLTNKGWLLNHGAPNFNIFNSTDNQFLNTFIHELLDANIIQTDSSDLIEMCSKYSFNSEIKSNFHIGENYFSKTSMSLLSKKIIELNNSKNQIDYYFESLIVKLEFKKNIWILTSKNGCKYKSIYLVCSSNLLLHKRSIDILGVNQIPIRKAIPLNKDKKLDSIINVLDKQGYVQRLSFIIYTCSNYGYKDNYKKQNRYFILSNHLQKK